MGVTKEEGKVYTRDIRGSSKATATLLQARITEKGHIEL